MGKRVGTARWVESRKHWRIDVQKDGKQRPFYSSTPGRKGQREANEKADLWLDDGIDGSTKTNIMCDKFIQSLKDRKTSKGHWELYERYLRLYAQPKIGNKKIGDVTEADLQNIINYAHSIGNDGAGLAKKTLQNIRACLHALLKFCRISKVSNLHPESLMLPKDAKKSSKGTLQPNDIKILFSSDKTLYRGKEEKDWFIHAYRLHVILGLRPGELVGLEFRDINGKICTIQRSFNEEGEETSGKNDNARRQFEIPDIGLREIKKQRLMLLSSGIQTTILFPDRFGERLRQENYRGNWKRYRDYNGISPKTPYELRHTFFSATKDLPAELIKPMGGHSASFDGENYKHKLDGDAHKTAVLVDDVFKEILK